MLKSKIAGSRLIILKKNKKSPPAPLPAISGFQIQIRKIRNHGRVSTGFGVAISVAVAVGVAVAVSVADIAISILGIAIAREPKPCPLHRLTVAELVDARPHLLLPVAPRPNLDQCCRARANIELLSPKL